MDLGSFHSWQDLGWSFLFLPTYYVCSTPLIAMPRVPDQLDRRSLPSFVHAYGSSSSTSRSPIWDLLPEKPLPLSIHGSGLAWIKRFSFLLAKNWCGMQLWGSVLWVPPVELQFLLSFFPFVCLLLVLGVGLVNSFFLPPVPSLLPSSLSLFLSQKGLLRGDGNLLSWLLGS